MGRYTHEVRQESEGVIDISYTFLFNAHSTQRDFRQLERLFADCDVYVPELANAPKEFREAILKLNSGEIRFDDFVNGYTRLKANNPGHGALLHRYKIMAGSQKPIFFAEKVGTSEEREMSQLKMRYLKDAKKAFREGNIEQSIESLEDFVLELAKSIMEREAYIKHMLDEPLKDFIKDRPYLGDNVKVLVQYGTAHTSLYREQVGKKRTIFNWVPAIYDPVDVLVRSLVQNPDYNLSREELLNAILFMNFKSESYMYMPEIDEIDTDLLNMVIAEIYRSLPKEKLREYIDIVKSGQSISMKEFFNITFPQTKEECKRVLKKYGLKENI